MGKVSQNDLLRWRAALEALARTGINFTPNLYDKERFEEVLKIALEMGNEALFPPGETELLDLRDDVELGIASRYITPKIGVSVAIFDESNRLLLNKRPSGQWCLIGGYADVGYSAAEVAVKEAKEEVGLDVEIVDLYALEDGLQARSNIKPQYSVMFTGRVIGGEIKLHPLESLDARWFQREEMPKPIVDDGSWWNLTFDAIEGKVGKTRFDAVREEKLRSSEEVI